MDDRSVMIRIFTIVILLFSQYLQAALIYTYIDRSELSVGDIRHFTVAIIVPKETRVIPPETDNGFGALKVKEWNIKKTEREKSDSLSFDYLITSYIPEQCTIPSLQFLLVTGNRQDTLRSEMLPLKMISVITTDSAALKDLKPQQTAGKAPNIYLWAVLLLLAAALIFFGIRYLVPRFRKIPPPPPPKPPYEEAIEAIRALEAKRYLEKGHVREYVFELSEIFKRYIERRFDINASEFTTEEMIAWLDACPLDKNLRGPVEWFFRTTDPVKFAKLIPDDETKERFMKEVKAFLENTRPVPEGTQKTAVTSAVKTENVKIAQEAPVESGTK